jgi:CHAD domain-containing protein
MSDASSPSPEQSPTADRDAETITDAGRRAVARWLKKTVRLVADCAGRSIPDADEIHRLRVAIRHTDAALITFRSLLPKKKSRRLRRRLRRLRRKAGKIRDIDVLLERAASLSASNEDGAGDPGADLRGQRRKLARQLRSAARQEIDDRLRRQIRGIVERIRWRDPDPVPSLPAVAAQFVAPLTADALAAGARDLADLARLHRFRVCVKRLRYAVEFLDAGLPCEGADRFHAELSGLQQRLGEVCDHAAAVQLLAAERESQGSSASMRALDEMIAREGASLAARKSEFVAWWQDVGRAELQDAIDRCSG